MVTSPPEGTDLDEYIKVYSNKLLGSEWHYEGEVNKQKTIFLRAAYRYENVFSLSAVERRNLAGRKSDPSQGSPDIVFRIGPVKINGDELIFVPVLYTMGLPPEAYYEGEENGYTDLEPFKGDDAMGIENDVIVPGQMSVTIQDLRSNDPPEPIVQDLIAQRHRTSAPFKLKIEKDSKLAPFMEYAMKPGEYQAEVEGFFLFFGLAPRPGRYRIASKGFGVRNYVSLIEFYADRA